MKINYSILSKAIWDIIKYPLMVVGLSTTTVMLGARLILYLGVFAFPVIVGLFLLFTLSLFVRERYKELIDAHHKEQQRIVDMLTR